MSTDRLIASRLNPPPGAQVNFYFRSWVPRWVVKLTCRYLMRSSYVTTGGIEERP